MVKPARAAGTVKRHAANTSRDHRTKGEVIFDFMTDVSFLICVV